MGELIGTATTNKTGLLSSVDYNRFSSFGFPTESGKFTHLFNLRQFSHAAFYLKFGDTATNTKESVSLIDVNNRSQGSLSVIVISQNIHNIVEPNLYARHTDDNYIEIYVKQIETTYPIIKFALLFAPESWEFTLKGTVSNISESELTKIL